MLGGSWQKSSTRSTVLAGAGAAVVVVVAAVGAVEQQSSSGSGSARCTGELLWPIALAFGPATYQACRTERME